MLAAETIFNHKQRKIRVWKAAIRVHGQIRIALLRMALKKNNCIATGAH